MAALALSARGESLTISNPSFEASSPYFPSPLTPGSFTQYPGPGDTIPGWNNYPDSGEQYYKTPANSSGGYEYTQVADGVQGAFSDSSLIWQTLPDFTLEAGTYTLTVASGWRGGRNYAGGVIELESANDSFLLGSEQTIQPLIQGTFTDTTLTVTIAPGSSEIGNLLTIGMYGQGQNGGTIDFDNVRLDFEPAAVPEPSTWLMFGAGVSLLAFARRRAIA